MPTQVLALDDIKKKDMLVVRAEGVRQYTGAGETAGASLALALQDMHAGQRREVEVFVALVAEEAPASSEPESDVPEPIPRFGTHEARIVDVQIGRIWTRLSSAVNTLAKNQRGRQTIDILIDGDDIIVRSTMGRRAFGFILDRSHRRIWGWRRKTYAIEPLALDILVTSGRLHLVYDRKTVTEPALVTQLAKRALWP